MQNPSSITLTIGLAIGLSFILSSCSGGGDSDSSLSGPPPNTGTMMVTTYYDAPKNTVMYESGPVQVDANGQATAIRHGVWESHFPVGEGNGVQWIRTFTDGNWAHDQVWTEFNADDSVRDAHEDGPE